MGLLDDAIREHLELKRRRGADPTEVARQEQEAFGPPRRGDFEAAASATRRVAEPALDEPATLRRGAGAHRAARRRRPVSGRGRAAAPHGDPADDLPHAEPAPEPSHITSRRGAPGRAAAPARRSRRDLPAATSTQPTRAFDAEEVRAATTPPPVAPAPVASPSRARAGARAREPPPCAPTTEGEADDVLEETPEFLQETPGARPAVVRAAPAARLRFLSIAAHLAGRLHVHAAGRQRARGRPRRRRPRRRDDAGLRARDEAVGDHVRAVRRRRVRLPQPDLDADRRAADGRPPVAGHGGGHRPPPRRGERLLRAAHAGRPAAGDGASSTACVARSSMLQEPARFAGELDPGARAGHGRARAPTTPTPTCGPRSSPPASTRCSSRWRTPTRCRRARPDSGAGRGAAGRDRGDHRLRVRPRRGGRPRRRALVLRLAGRHRRGGSGHRLGGRAADGLPAPPRRRSRRSTIDQGVQMGRPSRLECSVEGDRVRVGGEVVVLSVGTLHL